MQTSYHDWFAKKIVICELIRLKTYKKIGLNEMTELYLSWNPVIFHILVIRCARINQNKEFGEFIYEKIRKYKN